MSVNKGLASALIKNPNTTETYTEHELEEFAKCADPHDGFMHFAKNYAYIQHPVKGKLKFEPFPYQERMLTAFHEHRSSIMMCSRQLGKCVSKNTQVKLRNKKTGEIVNTTIGEFFDEIQKTK